MTVRIVQSKLSDDDPLSQGIDQDVRSRGDRRSRIDFHRSEIKRYSRLLVTGLTEIERKYVHDRMAERYTALNQLLNEGCEKEAAA